MEGGKGGDRSSADTDVVARDVPAYLLNLKTVDTIGNCQRLASTVGVSQHNMHKIMKL